MYSKQELTVYPYFERTLNRMSLEAIHDSLTGLIARPFMLDFIRDLIDRAVPFALAIVDLDNFKSINDNFGHAAGDQVLEQVSADLREFVGEDGLVGRFGGDELLIIYFKSVEYAAVHSFFMRMYHSGTVFRRELRLDDKVIYITATVGCAAFPKDGADYDGLFLRIDKALYRGKNKGRNCFIVYVPAKHDALNINSLNKSSLYETLKRMAEAFAGSDGAAEKLRRMFLPVRENLNINRLLTIDSDGVLTDAESGETLARLEVGSDLVPERVRTLASINELRQDCPPLYEALRELGLGSALLARVTGELTPYRYLILCPEAHTKRIWQDNEYCAAFILSEILSRHSM